MISVFTLKDKREVKVEARFAYPLNNLSKAQRVEIAQHCAQRVYDLDLNEMDVILDKVAVSGRVYAFASRRRRNQLLFEIGPSDHIPDTRLVRRGEKSFDLVQLSRSSIGLVEA